MNGAKFEQKFETTVLGLAAKVEQKVVEKRVFANKKAIILTDRVCVCVS